MLQQKPITLFWFRRDLRLEDNVGLLHALKGDDPVMLLFIFDTNILSQLESPYDRRLDFIHQRLILLNDQLKTFKSGICIRHGNPKDVFTQLIMEFPIKAVHANRDYEPYAIQRDQEVEQLLKTNRIEWASHKDQVIFEPGEVIKADQTPYTIYTPFAKLWRKQLSDDMLLQYPSEKYLNRLTSLPEQCLKSISLGELGFKRTDFNYRSPEININIIGNYHATRDYPAIDGTTTLSVHLRFGTISIRSLVVKALRMNDTWLGELIWREFFMTILFYYPKVVQQSFKKKYDAIPWRNNENEFHRWCSGTTGYPIVDAGMRQLNATGWMHNRVRMIVASFLTKHLLIDWRWGESYFANHLIDYDLAANNGNWQWAAGCGCDAAPYFRVFNPDEQTKRFDPEAVYIRRWVPEFESIKYLQNMIVEHKFARNRALSTYKEALAD